MNLSLIRLTLFTLFIALSGTPSAFAIPTKGDSATIKMLNSDDKKTVTVEYKQVIESVNAEKGFIVVRATYIQDGILKGNTLNKESYLDASTQNILADCENFLGGKLEDITLPKLGHFRACHQHMEQAGNTRDSYLSSQVPFGVVKVNSMAPGLKVEAELVAFEKK